MSFFKRLFGKEREEVPIQNQIGICDYCKLPIYEGENIVELKITDKEYANHTKCQEQLNKDIKKLKL